MPVLLQSVQPNNQFVALGHGGAGFAYVPVRFPRLDRPRGSRSITHICPGGILPQPAKADLARIERRGT